MMTYENETTNKKLETYEWDSIWWEYANDSEGKERILIIGDSISVGTRGIINKCYEGKKYVDNLGTSKGIDNPFLIPLTEYMVSQCKNCSIIQFNNGLHGWHLNAEEYKEHLDKTVSAILEKFPEKKLILALTTPLRDSEDLSKLAERNVTVLERNKAMLEIAEKYTLKVNDLYSQIIDKPEIYAADGVHLNDEGYEIIARHTISVFSEVEK